LLRLLTAVYGKCWRQPASPTAPTAWITPWWLSRSYRHSGRWPRWFPL